MLVIISDWKEEDGYECYLHDTMSRQSTHEDLSMMRRHILFEFLDYLGIVEYHKFYDSVYEIRIKKRD